MSAGVRESLGKAQTSATEAYDKWVAHRSQEDEAWADAGFRAESETLSVARFEGFVEQNWGKIATVGAAFGLPVIASDTGAFATVLGLVKTLIPIF
jgi:hypothetical protein